MCNNMCKLIYTKYVGIMGALIEEGRNEVCRTRRTEWRVSNQNSDSFGVMSVLLV